MINFSMRGDRAVSRRTVLSLSAAAVGGLALTGCQDGGSGAGSGEQPVLNVHANTSPTYQPNFNPLAPTVLPGTLGMIYEPLLAYTPMKPGEQLPWLAESGELSDDGTEVTFTLREGVTWSDGEPFTADDVAYTFNLYVEEPATNTGALPVKTAKASDDRTVLVTFTEPVFAKMPQIGNTIALPKHIFSSESAMEFTNEDPVGTGPYTLKSFSDQLYSFAKNPDHWDAESIKVNEIAYPSSTEQTFTTHLSQEKLDWSGGFVANIDELFVQKDPEHNHYWYPGDGSVNLLLNQRKAPMNDLEFRKALNVAIDRDELAKTAMQGYTPAVHPTGLVLPAFESAMNPEYADLSFTLDPDQANAILDDAGYKPGADGVRSAPDGDRLEFQLLVPSGWVDWIAITKLLQEQLNAIGIKINPQSKAMQSWADNRNNGNYDITLASAAAGSSPYFLYRSFMSSEFKVPDNKPASSNYGRWYDQETDALFTAYEATEDEAEQERAIHGLQQIAVERLPLIGLLQSPNWFQYRTENFVGWPTEEDPYALPAPYSFPDNLMVVKHLKPA